MARGRFAFWATSIFAGLIALKAGFPFLLAGLVEVSGCRGHGGACGAIALVAGVFGGIAILIGFLVACIVVFWRRLSHAGLSPLWLAAVASFALGGGAFIYGARNFWAANFSAGVIGIPFPYTLLALVGFAVFLSIYKCSEERPSRANRYAWIAAAVSAGVIVLFNGTRILGVLAMLPLIGRMFLSLSFAAGKALMPIYMLNARLPVSLDLLATIAFLVALAAIILTNRAGSSPAGSVGGNAPMSPPSPSDPGAVRGAFGRRNPGSIAR